MFENLVYFIAAIFITATYQPGHTRYSYGTTFLILVAVYATYYSYLQFRAGRLAKKQNSLSIAGALDAIEKIKRNGSLLALFCFIFFVYHLNIAAILPKSFTKNGLQFLNNISILILFIFFMCILWSVIFFLQKKITDLEFNITDYIKSNLTFPVSALIPWCIISILTDLTVLLPQGRLKSFIDTPAGEIIHMILILFVVLALVPVLVPKIWGCTILSDQAISERIMALCDKGKVKISRVFVWPLLGGTVITAAVLGFFSCCRYILITPALTKYLSPDEFDSVISHEIGHIRHNHVFLYILILGGFGFAVYGLTELLLFPFSFFLGAGIISKLYEVADNTVLLSIISLAGAGLFIPFFRYGFAFIMRQCERQADTFVYTVKGSARPLISTFRKIAVINQIPLYKPCWHHYSIGERIDFLEKCELNRDLIQNHNQKIKKVISGYFLFVICFTSFMYVAANTAPGKNLKTFMFEKGLVYSAEKNSKSPETLTALGDYYYGKENFHQAKSYYISSITISENSSENHAYTLNNLAWLLVTCTDPLIFDPETALGYAIRASSLDQSAHILDTLAECYFKTNDLENAVITAKKALEKADTNKKQYYEDQLQKFKEELESNSF